MYQSLDPQHPHLMKFRHTVLKEDFGQDPHFVDSLSYRSEFNVFPENCREDIYKFSAAKWNNFNFTEVETCSSDDRVVSVSGVRRYGDFLRIGMNYYTLKSARLTHRSLLWKKDGFCQRSFTKASGVKAAFIAIFPHNKKLTIWVDKLRAQGHLAQMALKDKSVIDGIRQFQVLPENKLLHGVPQLIMYKPLCDSFQPDELLKTIAEHQR